MKKIILTIISVLSIAPIFAQYAFFGTRGKIEFDKVTYIKAQMRDRQQNMNQNNRGGGFGGRMFDLDNMPESNTEKFIFEFDENNTLLYLDPNVEPTNPFGGGTVTVRMQGGARMQGAARMQGTNTGNAGRQQRERQTRPNNNSKITYQDLKNKKSEVQIQIDDKYILADTLQNITWRFTNEYRNIAGFDCRRVNGSTPDSLYLVAFYADDIPVSAGPALSSGLPGMILGLVIPEMHIQYWATKVEYTNDPIITNWRDKKAKALSLEEFVNSLGRYFQRGRDNNSNKRQVQEQLIY